MPSVSSAARLSFAASFAKGGSKVVPLTPPIEGEFKKVKVVLQRVCRQISVVGEARPLTDIETMTYGYIEAMLTAVNTAISCKSVLRQTHADVREFYRGLAK